MSDQILPSQNDGVWAVRSYVGGDSRIDLGLVSEIHGDPARAFAFHTKPFAKDTVTDMGQHELAVDPNAKVDALRVVSEVRFELIHVHPPVVALSFARTRWWPLAT